MYYLETADSVAQPFLHGANTPHYNEIIIIVAVVVRGLFRAHLRTQLSYPEYVVLYSRIINE
jgi:hypothetical protein